MTHSECASPVRRHSAPGWGQSLFTGAAGIALAHAEYARSGAGRWDTAHRWASATVRDPVFAHPDLCGLYQGAPAVSFALHAAARPAYAPALGILDQHVTTITRHRLEQAHRRIDTGNLPAVGEYDLIRGLTGIAVCLLHRHAGSDLLRDVLSYLVRLTEPLTDNDEALPGWWSGDGPAGRPSGRWPGGHANLGIAHGIAGPLALLSAAARQSVTVAGQADAIGVICGWLDGWRSGAGRQAWWPGTISRAEWQAGSLRPTGPQRPSWCYGTPGIARAQQLAGLALADPDRQQLAEQALAGCITDDQQLSQLTDASLCHGWAGLILTTWRAAADAGPEAELAQHLPTLRARLTEYLHRDGPHDDGLLEGSTGARLARHTTATDTPPPSCWDACLLLAG